jgi:hypothetical protein
MKDIAAQFGVSRGLVYRYLSKFVDEHEDKLRTARLMAAHSYVEDGLEILDNANEESPAGVSKAKERAHFRRWMAQVRNRDAYGEQSKGPLIALNVNSLHLDALKASGMAAALPGAPAEALPPGVAKVEEGECEVIEDGE